MTLPRRCAALLSAFFVLPLTLSACGGSGGVPSDAVVKIGSDTITKTAFDHTLEVTEKQAQQPGTLDPPNFTKCIAEKKKAAAKPAKGQPKPTDTTYKTQCQQQYTTLRDQAMQFLIASAWTEGESADRGIKLSDTETKKIFDKQRADGFTDLKDYLNFLKQSGFNQEDILYRVKVQELTNRLRAKVLAGSDKVSAAQISNYYNKNKSKFAVPERRDFRVVLTKTPEKAEQVKALLNSGQSWKAVASKYSLDKGTSDKGGLLAGVPKGRMEKGLDTAVFSAKEGEVGGPIKTQSGYIVFEVEKLTPGQQQSLKQSEAAIKQQLINQQQQTKLDAFQKDLQKKWKARTECQKGYAMQSCKNAPRAQPAPAGAGAGASSGGATTNK